MRASRGDKEVKEVNDEQRNEFLEPITYILWVTPFVFFDNWQ